LSEALVSEKLLAAKRVSGKLLFRAAADKVARTQAGARCEALQQAGSRPSLTRQAIGHQG